SPLHSAAHWASEEPSTDRSVCATQSIPQLGAAALQNLTKRSAEISSIRVISSEVFRFDQKRKRLHSFLNGAFVLMRRRPTLPYTFAHSTIGPAGLNFRVRDGNGWNPRGKITAKLRRFEGVSEAIAEREPSAEIPSVLARDLCLWILSMRGHQSGSTVYFS